MAFICDIADYVHAFVCHQVFSFHAAGFEVWKNPLHDSLHNHSDLSVKMLGISVYEVLDKLHVLVVLDGQNWLGYHLHHVVEKSERDNSWHKILIACYSLESIDALQSNCQILTLQVDALIQKENCAFKCIGILLEEHVNQVTKEQSVSHLYQLRVIV